MGEYEFVLRSQLFQPDVKSRQDGSERHTIVHRGLRYPSEPRAKGGKSGLLFRLNVVMERVFHVDVTGAGELEMDNKMMAF